MKPSLEKIVADHIKTDEDFQEKINRVIFGDDPNDKGMKQKVDEMHDILISARNIGGFFTSVKGVFGWLLILGAFVALIKGWFVGAVLSIFNSIR